MEIKTLEPILKELGFFKGLEQKYLELLVGCASNVRFEANSYIAHEGEAANHFYIVRHGSVAVEIHDSSKGVRRLQTLGDNELLGWSWLFEPYKWHFDVRALTLTRAIALDGACLRNKCENDPALGYEFMKRFAGVIVERLEAMRLQVLDIYG